MVQNHFLTDFHTVANIDSVSNKQISFKSHIYNIYGVRGIMHKNYIYKSNQMFNHIYYKNEIIIPSANRATGSGGVLDRSWVNFINGIDNKSLHSIDLYIVFYQKLNIYIFQDNLNH